ncbi:MAG TPA: DEAD/DEAH box helicase [Acidimicrobiales bacterium]|nr:DEAD/DEAH box helicase [Acidimicrobiales bacterium]
MQSNTAAPSFAELGVPPRLVEALDARGMTSAFEVQAATIPDALAGRDLCGRAPTGSGKTLAFGIPTLVNCDKARPGHPTALILSPTRELADQIRNELVPLSKAAGRFVHAVYGGVGYGPQTQAIRRGVDVLVACPGRLEDLINGGNVSLAEVGVVVVDEADRMADMGFLPAVKRLLDQTRDDRQTLLFSATLDGDIAELTRRYQHDPVRAEVGEVEPDMTAMAHHFWSIRHEDRVDHTRDAVVAAGPTIVFTRTRHGADRLCTQLGKAGVQAAAIHGGRNQNQRTRALEAFTRGQVQALVATDVAARGIHVDGVACVVHFDPPEDDKTYLHRSGRTARAGAQGVVVSFVRPNNRKDVKTLQRDLGLAQEVSEPDATLLGDGSRHREATARAAERPAGQRPARGGGDRPRTRTRSDRSRQEDQPRRDDRQPRRDDRPRKPKPRTEHTVRDWESHKRAKPARPDEVLDVDPRPRKERLADGERPSTPSKVHRKGGGAKRRARDAASKRG